MPGRVLVLEAPSGLAGDLLATALVRAGVPKDMLAQLPAVLDLEGFKVTWDEQGVCDGQGGVIDGTVDDLVGHVCEMLSDEVANTAVRALQLALAP